MVLAHVVVDSVVAHVAGVVVDVSLWAQEGTENVRGFVDGADLVALFETFLLEGEQDLILGLNESDVADDLQVAGTFDDLVPPQEGVLFALLGEVEFGNESVVGSGVEDGGDVLAELQSGDILVETLVELAALLHPAQIPENDSFGSPCRQDVLADVDGAELAAGTYLGSFLRLKVWMGALESCRLSHRLSVPSVPPLASSLSVSLMLATRSVWAVWT
jgi:hypothetical protein